MNKNNNELLNIILFCIIAFYLCNYIFDINIFKNIYNEQIDNIVKFINTNILSIENLKLNNVERNTSVKNIKVKNTKENTTIKNKNYKKKNLDKTKNELEQHLTNIIDNSENNLNNTNNCDDNYEYINSNFKPNLDIENKVKYYTTKDNSLINKYEKISNMDVGISTPIKQCNTTSSTNIINTYSNESELNGECYGNICNYSNDNNYTFIKN